MRALLIGLVVGGIAGFALQKFVLSDPQDARRLQRQAASEQPAGERGPGATDVSEVDSLRARIAELEARLAASGGMETLLLPGGVEVPTTEEGIDLLFEEFQQTDDLDKLLALFRALLLQGERGYPKLTKLILRVVGKGMAGRLKEEAILERVVPAFRIALRHEEELVGYVGYLLASEDVPPMMQTGAMAVAMFLSINRVPGSEAFAPKLLEHFMSSTSGPAVRQMGGGEQSSMLIQAMGMLRQPEAVDPLLAILADPDRSGMHRQAAEALGRIGDPRAVGPLVKRLQTMDQRNEWWAPEVVALARIGTPESTHAAEQYLTSIENADHFFAQAGSYIQARPSPGVIEMIGTKFRANTGASNMWSVMRGLNSAGTPESLALLQEIASTATQDHVKRRAQSYLDERAMMQKSLEEAAD
jgi:hypothetical protein